ncbi:MAG: glycosyltransferase, partial [Pseudomonadales bacterium]|nr:glycosyltransferase [Pseudomonadales bacterium]
KLVFFPNWSDTDFVKPGIDDHELRVEWGIRDYEKVVLYSGNIGAKQGLEMVLEAAEHYLNQPDVRFVIVGSGANKEALEQQAKERALTNVMFKPLIPWEQVPTLLSMADVHLVVQKKGAADAVLPSKLTNILSAGGHCVVTAEAHTELGCLAEKYPGIYSCIEPECLDAFIGAIDTELDRVASQNVNHVARRYAELNLNKEAVLRRFESDMDLLIGGGLRTTSENG